MRACLIRYQDDDKAAIREAEALSRVGFAVDVLLLRSASGRPKKETVNGVRYIHLPLRKRRSSPIRYIVDYVLWFLLCACWLAKESVSDPFDYVQVDSLPDHQVFAALIPKLRGARVGLFLKEPTEELYAALWGSVRVARMMGWLAHRSIGFSHAAFCVTEEHRQSYIARGIDPDKLHVVLNSMPPFPKASRSRPANDGKFVVVCHGTIEDRWGHDTIIDAAAHARAELPGLRVHLPGRGAAIERLSQRIDELGLAEVVSLDGWLSDEDLAQLLADADVGVVAQVANAYSDLVHTTKMYDFMQAALPVLATDLQATRRMFPTEITYVPSEASREMGDAFIALANDPQRREQQVAASLRRLEDLGWQGQMDTMTTVVRSLFSDR